MKLQFIIVMVLITGGLTSNSPWFESKDQVQPWFQSKGEGFLNNIKTHASKEHLGAVTAQCKAAIFPERGQLEALWMDITNMEVNGQSQFNFQVYFNLDLTPCNLPDSGLKTKIFVSSTDNYDVENPAPKGRDFREYWGDGDTFLQENGDQWKELGISCNDDMYFCGDPDSGMNWLPQKTSEKLDVGVVYKVQMWFLQSQIIDLGNAKFFWVEQISTPADGEPEANREETTVPMSMIWYMDQYGYFETVAFMNYDFKIVVYTSVTPGRTNKIQISARKIKANPCDNCEVSVRASAETYLIQDPSDWTVPMTDMNYPAFTPCYIKWKLKNAGDWNGRGLQLIQLDWQDTRRPMSVYPIWNAVTLTADARFDITIHDNGWNAEHGEVRVTIPALEAGAGAQLVFIGSFLLVKVNADGSMDPLDKSEIPVADGGTQGLYMETRLLQEDTKSIMQEYTSPQMASGEDSGAGEEEEGGFFSGISGYFTQSEVIGQEEQSHSMCYVAGGVIGAIVVLAGMLVATKSKFYRNKMTQYQRLYEA